MSLFIFVLQLDALWAAKQSFQENLSKVSALEAFKLAVKVGKSFELLNLINLE